MPRLDGFQYFERSPNPTPRLAPELRHPGLMSLPTLDAFMALIYDVLGPGINKTVLALLAVSFHLPPSLFRNTRNASGAIVYSLPGMNSIL